MTTTAKASETPGGKERVNSLALLPVALFLLSLLPFASVHPEHRLALAALAGLLGLGLLALGPRPRRAAGFARLAFALAFGALALATSGALPLGPEGRARLQPGLAATLDQALAVVGASQHPLALDPWRALLEWGLWAGLLGLAAGTARAVDGAGAARRLAVGLAAVGVFLLGVAALHRGQGAPSIWWVTGVPAWSRDPFFAPFVSPNHGGAACAALFGVTLGLALTGERRARLAAGLVAAGLLLGVWASGSRAAVLDAGAAALTVAVVAGDRRARAAVGVLLALGGVAVLLAGPGRVALWLTAQITPELYESIEAGYSDVLTGRADIFRDTLAIARAAPWLGVGGGSFDDAYRVFKSTPEFATSAHAHQELLQVAAEHGLLGLLGVLGAALALLVGGARAAIRASDPADRALRAGMLAGLVALAVDAQLDFPLRIGALATLAAVLAGALAGLSASDQEGARGGRALALVPLLGLLATGAAGWSWSAAPARSDWGPVELAERRGDRALQLAVDEEDEAAKRELVEAARAAWTEAARRQPTRREALQKLGRLDRVEGDADGARAAFEAAVAVSPTLPWPWRDLARLRARQGDAAGASEAWRRMLALNLPEDATPYVREALAGAADLPARAELALPPRADRWVTAAKIADDAGDRASAERFYRRAAELAPAAAIELAGALVRWGRPAEATALLPSLPGSCRKTLVESEIALSEERFEEARSGFERALGLCGAQDRRARLGLGRARAALGDPSGLRTLEALVTEDPRDENAIRALIREHEALGHFLEASRYQEMLNAPRAAPSEDTPAPER